MQVLTFFASFFVSRQKMKKMWYLCRVFKIKWLRSESGLESWRVVIITP